MAGTHIMRRPRDWTGRQRKTAVGVSAGVAALATVAAIVIPGGGGSIPSSHGNHGHHTTTTTTAPAATTTTTAPAATTTTTAPGATTTTTVGGGGGSDGATLTGIPSGANVCPGGVHASTLDSPYSTFSAASAAWPSLAHVNVAAGNNSASGQPFEGDFTVNANTMYWFAAGTHTLGTSVFGQIIPKDGDVFVGAPGSKLDGGGINRQALTQHAANVTVIYMEITNFNPFADQGVVNHDSGDGWTIKYSWIHDNLNGAAVMGGNDEVLQQNCLQRNGQYGLNACCGTGDGLVGITNMTVDRNDLDSNDTLNYDHPGGPAAGAASGTACGCAGGMKFWGVIGAQVINNYVHGNQSTGIWADTNNVAFTITGNYILNNYAEGIFYEISYNAYIHNNLLVGNAVGKGPLSSVSGFPVGAIYISESGADSRVSPTTCGGFNCGATLEISNNTLTNNWGGVVLWENSDRYCGSPANTSGSTCTLVNTGTATFTSCGSTSIASSPYINDCRWKTQNVKVKDNVISLTQASVTSCDHASGRMCGYNAIMSQSGTTQTTGDPFLGTFVANNITYNQNNTFSSNTYTGYWCFDPFFQGNSTVYSTWRAGPGGASSQWGASAYNQDGSTTYSSPNSSC